MAVVLNLVVAVVAALPMLGSGDIQWIAWRRASSSRCQTRLPRRCSAIVRGISRR
ncbi:hypothetical protein BJY01DRAFT_228717 [Aspergillus pseudoustus]|uniref:Uncharacterized protein n=1 Tax=Aspergillus pseudoustus TaxID=1810923 RepID=A0ABR4IK38_9EURO